MRDSSPGKGKLHEKSGWCGINQDIAKLGVVVADADAGAKGEPSLGLQVRPTQGH